VRTCVACKKDYPADTQVCPVHGTSLISEDELSDTITARASMASGGGAMSATVSSTPVVRSNASTPGGSSPGVGGTPSTLRESQPGSGPLSTDAIVGTTLMDRYEVTRKIGEGGMGVVYEARHTLIGKRVAIKVLLDKYAQKADIVARLQQEARLASSIGHEHIIDITDFGETMDGRTFVVMEYLEGESLAQLLQREGALPPARAVAIARQVAGALGAAHGKGVVHRDVKPENVFIVRRNDRDFAKVVDFGISKALKPEGESGQGSSSPRLTHTGMVLGTPLYMSPEQARGEDDLDHRIDIYALGVIMYELLTGEVPFRGTNYLSVISQVLSVDPKRPSELRPDLQLSAALESVVLKAMAKDRALRYQTMGELDADLARLEKGDEVVQALSSAALSGARPRKTTRGSALLWVAGVTLVVGATVAVVIPLTRGEDRPPAPPPVVIQQPAPQPTPQAAPQPPPVPVEEQVSITIDSKPRGAEVLWGAVSQGKTPMTLPITKGNETVNLTLRLDGYEDATVPFIRDKDKNLGVITLKKAKKGWRPPGPKPPTDPQNGNPTGPTGPKETPGNPYDTPGK
jgi:serine/threonine-protein kinase